ncbi:MAG TPA: hypothetical protein VJ867_10895 [Gemmatimonadaceae bacterium]|nr:hypothetical protein [Gemmatimonadaceae bacterium]
MTILRRAAPLAVALGVAACDVVAFASDPKPIFEQTWSLPTTETSIAVDQMIPSTVTIYSTPGSNPPDSSAFVLDIDDVVFASRVGDQCSQCTTLNGTSTTKPAFILTSGSSSPLPTDVVSGAVLGGTVNVSVVNNLSFDPIRVRSLSNPPQGYMILIVRSGSLVLGRDSIDGGDVAFPAGTTMQRSIPLSTGNVNAPIAIDLTVNSPQGDHNEFIDANGRLNTTGVITSMLAGNVTVNVANKSITNPAQDIDFGDFGSNVVEARVDMTILNPWSVAGNLQMNFTKHGSSAADVSKAVTVPAGSTPPTAQQRQVVLQQTEVRPLVGNKVDLTLTGTMDSPTPIVVTPKQKITIDNRLVLKVQAGGGQ